MLYEGLTRLLDEGEVELALAKSVDISEDGLTYIFHLKDASWSDGHPISAYDFEYSWKKILTPEFGSPCSYLLYCIKHAEESAKGKISPEDTGIKALDSKTLRVILKNPTPYFLSLISFCNFYPIPKHVEIEHPSWNLVRDRTLVSSGPFRLEKWVPNQEILVLKNTAYWDVGNVHLDGIQINIIGDDKTSLRMFENKELDLLNSLLSSIPIDDLVNLKKKGMLQTRPIGGTLFCTFNLAEPLLKNQSIRRALSCAIDRQSIIENISQLSEQPATRFVPPVLNHDKTRKFFPVSDPDLALALFRKGLRELGIDPNDPNLNKNPSYLELVHSLTLSYEGIAMHKRIAQAIQEQWKQVLGFEIKLREYNFKNHLEALQSRNYSIGLDYWIVQFADPVNILERFKYKHSKKNFPGYENPEYIQILTEASSTNQADYREELLERAEQLIASEMPLTPIYHFNQAISHNANFTDLHFSPIGTLVYKKIRPVDPEEMH
jgi:oligopeptide transport system substrate-binding protein